MAVRTVPERVRWAVDTLAVRPADRVLEIGCGRGVAVSLVGDRLTDGTIVAIDRSLTMIKIATQRNAEHLSTGRAVLHATALDAADWTGATFNKVFAINVSLFWIGPASDELTLVRQLLRPGGRLYLFYEPPTADRAAQIGERLAGVLGANRFRIRTVTAPKSATVPLVGVVARPA